ncbi:MAG TPA: DUF87 domain-containing protein [Myxococcota bacterium]|nr:DUF87 domain-containing protein [Myxococcota bacterium]
MTSIEKLGAFYLGRHWDQLNRTTLDVPVMLDSRDLLTHAVCLGMTGSGKTGLGVAMLEEAAIDQIPAIVIDPKGDMTNLALTFPGLAGQDFEPWIDAQVAAQKGVDVPVLAQQTAQMWANGIQEWGQDAARIQRFKDAARVEIYTPGSSTAPLSILKAFSPPSSQVMAESDLYADTLSGTVSALLTLIGVDPDPAKSKELVLISSILDRLWRNGEGTDLAGLITLVQNPPMTQIGVFNLDMFYPAPERMKLAMALNNLLASPDFSAWIQGPPLDINSLLYTPEGKPKLSVISISHLDDQSRMFVVSLVLNRLLTWVRAQNGTSSLRALFYMDEIFGFLPPVAQPPSKKPLLTLLKQARAFGLGLVLCTQNPADIDYKALSNIGIWMIGRLQTEQDRNRLLDGLKENPALGDRAQLGGLISALDKRAFLMHNVHDERPYIFKTRWCLSYLAGPLSREQLRRLVTTAEVVQPVERPKAEAGVGLVGGQVQAGIRAGMPPVLPASISPVFLPPNSGLRADEPVVYRPSLLAFGSVYYADARYRLNFEEQVMALFDDEEKPLMMDWEQAIKVDCAASDLRPFQPVDGKFFVPPAWMINDKEYKNYASSMQNWLLRSKRLTLWRSPSTKLVSAAGEAEQDFRLRLKQAGREERDLKLDAIKKRYATRVERLQNQIRQAEDKLEKEHLRHSNLKKEAALAAGRTLFSGLFGGRGAISKASTAMRKSQRSGEKAKDVELAQQRLADLQQQELDLQAELSQEIENLQAALDPMTEVLEEIEILPKKTNISLHMLTLCWLPYSVSGPGILKPLWSASRDQ